MKIRAQSSVSKVLGCSVKEARRQLEILNLNVRSFNIEEKLDYFLEFRPTLEEDIAGFKQKLDQLKTYEDAKKKGDEKTVEEIK